MTIKTQLFFWLTCIGMLALFVFLFNDVLAPFVIGIAVAYLLNPLVISLERLGLTRTLATLLILAVFVLLVFGMLLLVVPPLYRELAQLAASLPEYFQTLGERLQPYLNSVEAEVDRANLDQSIQDAVQNNLSNAFTLSSSVLGSLLSGGRALAGFLSLLFITPLVAFFMMREWASITAAVDDLIPRHNHDKIKELLGRIDGKIAGFIRGQLLVALSLGLLYALALSIAGLEYGILVGLLSGLLSIIPLFGSIVGLVTSVVLAWLQSSDLLFVAIVAFIFVVGQLLEGNVISPKLLGGSVGLHPLWILFSIMAGASLFGIVGMMISVPVAATVGVLLQFAIERYQDSPYYKAGDDKE